MDSSIDVIVVGAGLAGAGTAWAATRRGLSVLVLEQFTAANERGSSHGSARIVRRAYGDGLYVRLTGHAFELWREVERASGHQLLRMYGGLDFGQLRDVPKVAALLTAEGVPHEVLPAEEAAARWPGMWFDGPVVFHPQGGTMDAAGSVEAMLGLARASGAEDRFDTAVASVEPDESGVTVRLADGTSVRGRVAVVAAGGWVAPLVGKLITLPPIAVTQQQVFHFPRLDPSAAPWPSVIHEPDGHAVYHLAGGRDGGPGDDRKIGEHDGGHATTAADRDGVADPASKARLIEYVKRYLPGLDPAPSSETTCLYTQTPTEDFLIDRVGPVVVCSPCSGHGAKFAPLIGELTTDLVMGTDRAGTFPERFRLTSHALARSGAAAVSL